jgi:hypothetical protein
MQENRPARWIDPATTPRPPEPPRTSQTPRRTRLELPAPLKAARASLSRDRKPAPSQPRAPAAPRHLELYKHFWECRQAWTLTTCYVR